MRICFGIIALSRGADANYWRMHDCVRVVDVGAGAIPTGRGVFREGKSFCIGDARALFADSESDLCFREHHDCGSLAFLSASGMPADIPIAWPDADRSGAERVGGIARSVWG